MPDDITLHTSCQKQVTCISNSFIDRFMPDANGEYVKIYLYLLRCLSQDGMDFSVAAMSDTLDHTERDIMRALRHWEKKHLLRLEYDGNRTLVGICLLDPDKAALDIDHANTEDAPIITGRFMVNSSVNAMDMSSSEQISYPNTAELKSASYSAEPNVSSYSTEQNISSYSTEQNVPSYTVEWKIPSYSSEQIASFTANPDIQEIKFVAERYVGHQLSATDINTFLFWYDELDMTAELIEYLIESCVEAGHTSMRYMNKVAISWKDENITTVEAAKEHSKIHSRNYYGIMNAFGISGRKLIASEQKYLDTWTNTYAFTIDIITEACRRTINNTGKASFEYADRILKSWFDAGVKNINDIAVLDSRKPQRQKSTGKTSGDVGYMTKSYDYSLLEQQLLKSN